MIGTTVSHYRITEKLGRGGMAVVYRAHDTALDRDVALKFLAPELADDERARKRFLHEARAASKLRHKHICTIHEIGEAPDGQPFICMDLYDGETLDARIARSPLSLEEAVRVVAQIGSGLSAAHSEGITHRDIKPANIMLPADGDVVILDFGLASVMGATRLTKTGTTVGTVSYMSPEAVQGGATDGRSDVWSLAVLAWEAVTGRLPFAAEHETAAIYRIVNEPPGAGPAGTGPSGVEPAGEARAGSDVPDVIRPVMERALEKDPGARYQTVSEFVEALAAAAGVELPSLEWTPLPAPRPRRNWIRFAAAAVLVAAIAAGAFLVPKLGDGGAQAGEMAVAIVDFGDASGEAEFATSVTTLVNVGLVESSPIRVVSPSLLHDLRRRIFEGAEGPIASDEALELARQAGATVMVRGDVIHAGDRREVAWQMVDTEDGRSIAAARSGGTVFECADGVVARVVLQLESTTGVATTSGPVSVSRFSTSSPEAWEHYIKAGEQFLGLGDVTTGTRKAVALDPQFGLAYLQLSAAFKGYPETSADSVQYYLDRAWAHRDRLDTRNRLKLEVARHEMAGRTREMKELHEEILKRWPDDRAALSDYLVFLNFWVFPEDMRYAAASLAVELYPDDTWFLMAKETSAPTTDEAVRVARENIRRHPDFANGWDELGLRFIEAGEPDSAEVAFRRALEIDPTQWFSSLGFAYCALLRGDPEQALEVSSEILSGDERSLKQRVDGTNLYYSDRGSIGLILYDAGRYSDALSRLDQLSREAEGNDWLLYRLTFGKCRVLLTSGRCEEALQTADRAMARMDLGFKDILLANRAHALACMDSLGAARSALLGLVQADDPDTGLLTDRSALALLPQAQVLFDEGDYEGAASALIEMDRWGGATMGWLRTEARKLLARTYAAQGDTDEAVQVLRDFMRPRPTHALTHYELGKVYELQGRAGDAAAEYNTFLEMWKDADPDLAELHDARERLERLATEQVRR